jgi:hypothetical protein
MNIIHCNCNYAWLMFISEHIVVSRLMLGSILTSSVWPGRMPDVFLIDPTLQHLKVQASGFLIYTTLGILVTGKLNQFFTAVTYPNTDLANSYLTSVVRREPMFTIWHTVVYEYYLLYYSMYYYYCTMKWK